MSTPVNTVKDNKFSSILVIQSTPGMQWEVHTWTSPPHVPSHDKCEQYAHGRPWTLFKGEAIDDSTVIPCCKECGQPLPKDRTVRTKTTIYPI